MNETKKSLTGREKFLIFFAGAVALFYAAVQFGITPVRDSLAEKQNTWQALTERETEMNLRIAGESVIRQANEDAKAEYADVASRYPAMMTAEVLIREINGLCESVGLARAGAVSDPKTWEALVIRPVTPPEGEEAPQEPAETAYERVSGTETDLATASFIVATVNVNAEGDIAALKALLDRVAVLDHIRVTDVTLPFGDSTAIPILFEVTMRNFLL